MNRRERELKSNKIVKVQPDIGQLSLLSEEANVEPKSFTFDGVFDDDSRQRDVYDETAYPLVGNVMEGYNGTIFAYGQTGCGKTFTMEGLRDPPEMRGIIPNTFEQIFTSISCNSAPGRQYLVQGSYLEIYNEEIRDLLGDNPKMKLDLKEDADKGVYVKSLTRKVVKTSDEIQLLMLKGNDNRTKGATAMNAESSRSHSIFIIDIEASDPVPDEPGETRLTAGRLNLVDLAGSERQSKTHAEGVRLKEATKINLSLTVLGTVISALAAAKKGQHIPYRDSKLTRLLQSSLGGNTKTIMIAAVSPASDNYDETLSTLRYANRAKNIKNKPKINEDPKDALLREYQDEIKRLKAMLESQVRGGSIPLALEDAGAEAAPRRKKAAVEEYVDDEFDENEAPRRKKKRDSLKIEEFDESPRPGIEQLRHEAEQEAKRLYEEQMRLKEQHLLEEMQRQLEEQRSQMEEHLRRLTEEKERHEKEARELAMRMGEKENVSKFNDRSGDGRADDLAEEKRQHEQDAMLLANRIEAEQNKSDELEARIAEVQTKLLEEKEDLTTKLQKLEQQLIEGGHQAQDLRAKHTEELRKAQAKVKDQRKKQANLEAEKQKTEEAKLMLEEKYNSIQEEVVDKTRKLKMLRKKYKQAQDEVADLTEEFQTEKATYLNNIRDIFRELRLFKSITESFLTPQDIEKIVRGSSFDEEKDSWALPKIEIPTVFPRISLETTPARGMGKSREAMTSTGERRASGGNTTASAAPPSSVKKGNQNRSRHVGGVLRPTRGDEDGGDLGWKRSVQAYANEASNIPVSSTTPGPKARKDPAPARLNPLDSDEGIRNVNLSPRAPADPVAIVNSLPKPKANFAPAKNEVVEEAVSPRVDAELPKRGVFKPPSHPLRTSVGDPSTIAENLPRRPRFEPPRPANEPVHEKESAMNSALNAQIKRPNFTPAIVPSRAPEHLITPEALPTPSRGHFSPARNMPSSDYEERNILQNLPAAKSFQPASQMSFAIKSPGRSALDVDVPTRIQFRPPVGVAKDVDNDSDDDFVNVKIDRKPRFQPSKLLYSHS